MKPRGPLMIEHRLIEKMLSIAGRELENIKNTNSVDPVFIDTFVDFIRTYADRTHHGKEEDILFKELEKKTLKDKDKKVMQDLINEHVSARKIVKELVESKTKYIDGNPNSIHTIMEKLTFLINFYPQHIQKKTSYFSLIPKNIFLMKN